MPTVRGPHPVTLVFSPLVSRMALYWQEQRRLHSPVGSLPLRLLPNWSLALLHAGFSNDGEIGTMLSFHLPRKKVTLYLISVLELLVCKDGQERPCPVCCLLVYTRLGRALSDSCCFCLMSSPKPSDTYFLGSQNPHRKDRSS